MCACACTILLNRVFFLQRANLSSSVPVLEQAVLDFCDTELPPCITIADLGCSSGPNTLFAVTQITSLIYERCSQLGQSPPEFSIFLNDLPGNDFNTVFQSFLPAFKEKIRAENGSDFGPCYISGVPGSFYGRLFPSNSLHFVHSGTSLHWLSQVCHNHPTLECFFFFMKSINISTIVC